jgi:hypothetical protein
MENTPPDVLYELGIRAFTGSRDVPKDDEKANVFLLKAVEKAIESGDQKFIDMAEYY